MVIRHYLIRRIAQFFLLVFAVSACSFGKEELVTSIPTLMCPNNISGLKIITREHSGYFSLYFDDVNCINVKMYSKKAVDEWEDYLHDKLQYLRDYVELDRKKGKKNYDGPSLMDCGISGEVLIYSDVDMLGMKAGENLIDFFKLDSQFLVCSYPDFKAVELVNTGTPLKDCFSVGTALPNFTFFDESPFSFYCSDNAGLPSEFNLSIEIPIELTDWSVFSWTERGKDFFKQDTKRVLSGTVTVNNL